MRLIQPVQLAPGRWLLPRLPLAHPAALRRIAVDCRELDAVLGEVARDAQWVVSDLSRGWRGRAARTAPQPLDQLVHDIIIVRRALAMFADELDQLAAAVQQASEQHDWSWRKIAAVSAVVGVTAGAVVVTVGSAGTATAGAAAAETAVVSAAAGELAAASTSVAAAETAAVEGLLAAGRLTQAVVALRAIVVPRLMTAAMQAPVWVETPLGAAAVSGSTTAGLEWLEDGRVAWGDVGFSAVTSAGESYVLSTGRTRGYVELTPQRLARMRNPVRRQYLLRITRSIHSQGSDDLHYEPRQLRTHHKHASWFGVSGNYNKRTSAEFEAALRTFVARPETVRIVGLWKRQPAVFHTDFDSGLTVVSRPNGAFWTGLKLGDRSVWHLWHDGTVGGG